MRDGEGIDARKGCGTIRILPERKRSSLRKTSPFGGKFTLVEMLVVVAIICILAALLMPALTSALNTARQAACANNQKQIMLAVYTYLQDYNNWFPPEGPAPLWKNLVTLGYLPATPQYFAAKCEASSLVPTTYYNGASMGINRWFTTVWGTPVTTNFMRIKNLPVRGYVACTKGGTFSAYWYVREDLGYWHNAQANVGYLDCHVGTMDYYSLPESYTTAFNNSLFFNPRKN